MNGVQPNDNLSTDKSATCLGQIARVIHKRNVPIPIGAFKLPDTTEGGSGSAKVACTTEVKGIIGQVAQKFFNGATMRHNRHDAILVFHLGLPKLGHALTHIT